MILCVTLVFVLCLPILGCGGASGASQTSAQAEEQASAASADWYASIPQDVPVVDFRTDPEDPGSVENFRAAQEQLEELVRAFTPKVYVIGLDFSWDYLDTSLFWVKAWSDDITYDHDPDDAYNSTYHGMVEFEYNCAPEDVVGMQAQIDAVAGEILSLIPEGADDWTRALYIHDELVRRVTYDPQVKADEAAPGSLHCRDIYGALVEGNAVCVGYAYAFDYLCRQAGVLVDLMLTDDMVHIYTAFAVEQQDAWSWCYVDPTWSDFDEADVYGNAYVDHSYFGISEEEMESYDSHDIAMSSYSGFDSSLNWYVRTNNYLYDASYESILAAFGRQYANGGNYLEIRLDTDELHQQARDFLFGNDCAGLSSILTDLGYFGQYIYRYNDAANTIGVGINAPA